jgi:hypothetical protein
MNWNEPIITPAMGAYALIALVAVTGLTWLVARMLNDRRPINDPIEDEYRGRE